MLGQALSADSLIGVELSHYRILEQIGSGGMGVVFRAHDQHLDREVAIKVLSPGTIADQAARKRLRKEALALSKVNHPNIATVYDFDAQRGVDFLVMEYIPGVTLKDKLAGGPLPEKEVLRLGMQLSEGLAAAHEHEVVHRDLKPGNLRLTPDGRLKILDFGLAKLLQPLAETATTESSLQTHGISGTLPYMAPEQLAGEEVDARTDIHAAGFVLYEMAAGQRPFAEVPSGQLMGALMRKPPIPPTMLNPRVSAELERIIGKCVEIDPENRYQSAKELGVDLRHLLAPSAVKLAGVPVAGRKPWRLTVPAIVVLSALAAGSYFYFYRAPKLTDKDTIVLADFTNTTGDPVFDGTLRQGLSVQLEQSPFLSVISDDRVQQALRMMEQKPDAKLTPEISREVCERTGSGADLEGSIAQIGTQYLLTLKAVNCTNGDTLASSEAQASDKNHVLDALGRTATAMRAKLGESLVTVQKFNTPVEEATTPSLKALNAYSLGMRAMREGDADGGLRFFRQAVELDPNFAMAYERIAEFYWVTNEGGLAAEYTRKAYDLREKVSEREGFQIEVMYYWLVTGELEKAAQTCELWQQTYSKDSQPTYMSLGILSLTLGNREKGLEEFRGALRADPKFVANYINLGVAYMLLNKFDEAETAWKEAGARSKDTNEILLQNRYELAFLKGDGAQMAQLASAAMGKPDTEEVMLAIQADTEGWYGRLKSAHELTGRAMDSARHNGAKEKAAAYQAEAALREAEAGYREEARAEATAALKLASNRDVLDIAALALARAGDTPAAEKLAAELDQRFPLDTLVQRYWLPAIRAAVALERRDPNRAIELLQAASNIELGVMVAGNESTIAMCPAYLRGEAYLMLHDGSRAAVEFQKFIDDRGVVTNSPWGALARLGLARAYAMQGDTAKTKAAYQGFLGLWKDADPDIPILKQAKSEYARLR